MSGDSINFKGNCTQLNKQRLNLSQLNRKQVHTKSSPQIQQS